MIIIAVFLSINSGSCFSGTDNKKENRSISWIALLEREM